MGLVGPEPEEGPGLLYSFDYDLPFSLVHLACLHTGDVTDLVDVDRYMDKTGLPHDIATVRRQLRGIDDPEAPWFAREMYIEFAGAHRLTSAIWPLEGIQDDEDAPPHLRHRATRAIMEIRGVFEAMEPAHRADRPAVVVPEDAQAVLVLHSLQAPDPTAFLRAHRHVLTRAGEEMLNATGAAVSPFDYLACEVHMSHMDLRPLALLQCFGTWKVTRCVLALRWEEGPRWFCRLEGGFSPEDLERTLRDNGLSGERADGSNEVTFVEQGLRISCTPDLVTARSDGWKTGLQELDTDGPERAPDTAWFALRILDAGLLHRWGWDAEGITRLTAFVTDAGVHGHLWGDGDTEARHRRLRKDFDRLQEHLTERAREPNMSTEDSTAWWRFAGSFEIQADDDERSRWKAGEDLALVEWIRVLGVLRWQAEAQARQR